MGGRGASYGMQTEHKHMRIFGQHRLIEVDRPRFGDREQLPFPTKPPYTAHLGNLTYDVTSVDIEGFFNDCQVTSVRIVEDKLDHKPKGFGYVEFATPDGLKKALTLTESNFMGRNVKISVAEPRMFAFTWFICYNCLLTPYIAKDRPDATRDFSDWSRKGPLPDLPQNQRQSSNRGYSRGGFDNMSDAGSERGGSRRGGFFEGDGKVRDFSNWERKGPLSPAPNNGPSRDGGRLREAGPPDERRQSPAWGEGRSDAGSRPPRREFEPRPPVDRAPTASEQDSQWRSKMRPDPSPVATPDVSTPSSPQQQAPKERPRLNLTKRTVSTAEPDSATSASDSKASPFGAAKPIDTAGKEREIEEKRELAIRQKKEADDKAKEDKVARESAARAARAERADHGLAQEDTVTSPTSESGGKGRRPSRQQNGTKQAPKENGETPTAAKPSFSILRRDTDGGEDVGEAGAGVDKAEEDANGTITDDKETKPQDVVKEVPTDASEGAVQNAEPTAEAMQQDGWSTVATKPKNNRRAGGRAIAS